MKASFDGARRNLVSEFNDLTRTDFSEEQLHIMRSLRNTIVALLCMYDDSTAGDCNNLVDVVHLEDV